MAVKVRVTLRMKKTFESVAEAAQLHPLFSATTYLRKSWAWHYLQSCWRLRNAPGRVIQWWRSLIYSSSFILRRWLAEIPPLRVSLWEGGCCRHGEQKALATTGMSPITSQLPENCLLTVMTQEMVQVGPYHTSSKQQRLRRSVRVWAQGGNDHGANSC